MSQTASQNAGVGPQQPAGKVPPQAKVMQAISGLTFSMVIKSAVELGIFRAIKEGFHTIEEMSRSLEVEPSSLRRLLRALAAIGLLNEQQGVYSATELGATLQPGPTPKSIEPLAQYLLHDVVARPMLELSYSVRTGKPSFEKAMGASWYEYCQENQQYLQIMDRAMEAYSKISLPNLLASYPFSGFKVIVDIAGGMGQLLSGILKANPGTRGILFDLPETTERAVPFLKAAGIEGRYEIVPGDMFEKVPAGGELYIISKALNDWDDEHVLRALRNVREAMSQESRLILIEMLGADNAPSPEEVFRDLLFLVCSNGGKVRTESEFRELIGQAGLQISRIIPGQFAIIECLPC